MPVGSVVGELEHDLWDSDWVTPRTVSDSVTSTDGVRHVRSIGFVEVDTVPTLWEMGLNLHSVGTVSTKVEVVGLDTVEVWRGLSLTSESEVEIIGGLGVWVADQHPQPIGKRGDSLGRR